MAEKAARAHGCMYFSLRHILIHIRLHYYVIIIDAITPYYGTLPILRYAMLRHTADIVDAIITPYY